jgi:hypothetical protein
LHTVTGPTALGWLKVRYYAEVPEHYELLSPLSIHGYRLAIGYFGVVKGGGVSFPSFLHGLRGLGSGTRSLDFSSRSSLNLVGQPLGRDCCPDSSWGLRRRPGYVEKVKVVRRWVILNSLFRFCIWHTGRPPSVIYDASKS